MLSEFLSYVKENIACVPLLAWVPVHSLWRLVSCKTCNAWIGTRTSRRALVHAFYFAIRNFHFSNNLPNVSNIHATKMKVVGGPWFTDGDHTGVLPLDKCWVRMTASNILTSRDTAHRWRCFSVLLGMPLGRGALPNFKSRKVFDPRRA